MYANKQGTLENKCDYAQRHLNTNQKVFDIMIFEHRSNRITELSFTSALNIFSQMKLATALT